MKTDNLLSLRHTERDAQSMRSSVQWKPRLGKWVSKPDPWEDKGLGALYPHMH